MPWLLAFGKFPTKLMSLEASLQSLTATVVVFATVAVQS
jgi:hypothetical protein